MIKSAFLALATTAATLAAGSAHAGGVSWSIGINTPIVGTVISNAPVYGVAYGPVYAPEPYYDEPAPVYAPVPVYRAAPPVAYYPRETYYRPVPVVYPRYYPGWRHGRDRDRDGDRGRDRDHERDHDRDRGGWGGRR